MTGATGWKTVFGCGGLRCCGKPQEGLRQIINGATLLCIQQCKAPLIARSPRWEIDVEKVQGSVEDELCIEVSRPLSGDHLGTNPASGARVWQNKQRARAETCGSAPKNSPLDHEPAY